MKVASYITEGEVRLKGSVDYAIIQYWGTKRVSFFLKFPTSILSCRLSCAGILLRLELARSILLRIIFLVEAKYLSEHPSLVS